MHRINEFIEYLYNQWICLFKSSCTDQIRRPETVKIFPFESFISLPPEMFDPRLNNPDIHDIENLYLRYDGTTGEKNYFYRSFFKPHVQLNSVSADLADNSARSYPVTCDFSYLIQLPIWL